MRLLYIILGTALAVVLASVIGVYVYGKLAGGGQGEASFALPVTAAQTPIDRMVAPLLEGHDGESGLILLRANVDAFAVRARSARQAGRSLDLVYYIWEDDLTGRLLMREVIDAADRGVRVRLLLDDVGAQAADRAYTALDAHPGIEVRLFNPSRNRGDALRRGLELLLRAFSATRRMHNKAWIADGRLAVVGGRNIGDAYFDADEEANFRDLDLVVLGAGVRQAEGVFDAFWNSKAVVPLRALVEPREADLVELRARVADQERAGHYLAHVEADISSRNLLSDEDGVHWTEHAAVVSDPPEKLDGDGRETWLMSLVQPLVESARTTVEIVSPYFIPGEDGTAWLRDMVGRGVDVSVLTNSLAATDVTAVHGAYARYREPLLEGGVRLFELKPYDQRSQVSLFGSSGASLHTKAFTVDDRIGFVGSMNFDPRSLSLNTEMGIMFEHPDLVRQLRLAFADETSPRKSYRVRIEDGDLVWEDGGTPLRTLRREPEAPLRRRLAAWLTGLLPIESQL